MPLTCGVGHNSSRLERATSLRRSGVDEAQETEDQFLERGHHNAVDLLRVRDIVSDFGEQGKHSDQLQVILPAVVLAPLLGKVARRTDRDGEAYPRSASKAQVQGAQVFD